MKRACVVYLVPFWLLLVHLSVGQLILTPTGTPPFTSSSGGPFDSVNEGSLNVHFAIPVLHKAGRGIPFAYDLIYDSSLWAPVKSSSLTETLQWTPAAG